MPLIGGDDCTSVFLPGKRRARKGKIDLSSDLHIALTPCACQLYHGVVEVWSLPMPDFADSTILHCGKINLQIHALIATFTFRLFSAFGGFRIARIDASAAEFMP
jgi:hypothetical protein